MGPDRKEEITTMKVSIFPAHNGKTVIAVNGQGRDASHYISNGRRLQLASIHNNLVYSGEYTMRAWYGVGGPGYVLERNQFNQLKENK
jgi:hypothetical protein